MATEQQWATLGAYADEALSRHDPSTADYLRSRLMADECRVIGVFELGPDGEPVAESLSYRLDVRVADGWAPLVKVHWSRFEGLTTEDVATERASVKAQREMGITPDRWDG